MKKVLLLLSLAFLFACSNVETPVEEVTVDSTEVVVEPTIDEVAVADTTVEVVVEDVK